MEYYFDSVCLGKRDILALELGGANHWSDLAARRLTCLGNSRNYSFWQLAGSVCHLHRMLIEILDGFLTFHAFPLPSAVQLVALSFFKCKLMMLGSKERGFAFQYRYWYLFNWWCTLKVYINEFRNLKSVIIETYKKEVWRLWVFMSKWPKIYKEMTWLFSYNICHCQEQIIFSPRWMMAEIQFSWNCRKNAMGNDECEDITLRNEQ